MGPQTTISMFAGTIIGWAILSPLADRMGWTNGVPMDAEEGSKGGCGASVPRCTELTSFSCPPAWILWVSLAIMTSESIVGLMTLTWSQLAAPASPGSGHAAPSAQQYEPSWRRTPASWVLSGLLLSTLASTLLLPYLFNDEGDAASHIAVWVPLVGIIIAAALSVLAVRALGATDLNPVNALGKVSEGLPR